MTDIMDRFMQALQAIEGAGTFEPMLDLFSENSVAYNPLHIDGLRGKDGIRRFWHEYNSSFDHVETRFTRRAECETGSGRSISTLEWVSNVDLAGRAGHAEYGGVTILEHDSSVIHKLNSYYDTAQLMSGSRRSWVQPETEQGSHADSGD